MSVQRTQKENSIYLIGKRDDSFKGRKLPTNRKALSVFFYKHSSLKLTIRNSATKVVEEISDVWDRAGIPVCRKQNAATKLVKLHHTWTDLYKNRKREKSRAQKTKEYNFVKKLDELFDIASHNAEETLTQEQRQLLISQRAKKRRGLVPTHRGDPENVRRTPSDRIGDDVPPENVGISNDDGDTDLSQALSQITVSELSGGLSQTSSACGLQRTISDFENELSQEIAPKAKKINIMTPDLVAALDRTQTSSRNATFILAAAATSLGFDVNDINLSSSAIHKQRIKHREQIAKKLKDDLQIAACLVVHWDGKLLPEIETGKGSVERLPIIVSGVGTEHLLGVPKLPSGTGANQAEAIIKTLREWNLTHRVKAMCFDTTSTNTGRLNGACTLLERELGGNLLHLACRHHVYELLLRCVVEIYWPVTSGPNVPIFKRFQQHWPKIDVTQFETGVDDASVADILTSRKNRILDFISNQFQVSQPRDDYREFLELSCIFLGGEPPRGVRFKTPGAVHHARWLSKAIYCLKIFLFRKQFLMKARDTNGLRQICIFVVEFYVESWFTAPSAIKAPNHDLELLQRLVEYRKVNADVSKAASSKLASHLWYLSEELAPLAFFDDTVPMEVQARMAVAIRERESNGRNVRGLVEGKTLDVIVHRDISDFITKKSIFLFSQFELPYDFLHKSPEYWALDETYLHCRSVLKDLKVINDVAERGVALIEEYNEILTKDEEQKQYLLQIVKNHRQLHPTTNKRNL